MQNEKISRHQFLRKMGLGGSALLAVYCAGTLSSCENEPATPSTGNSSFTIDLSATANAALAKNGGYIVKNDVVIAKTNLGTYVAVTVVCSHEGNKAITYQTNQFVCTVHDARFDNAGKGLNANGTFGIQVYPTSVSGNILTVTV
jgi:nitrite reductase/ring-hydroxylating ferredoxin subunit